MKYIYIVVLIILGCNWCIAQQIFSSDIKVNGLTVGKGGGNVSYNTAFGVSALASNNSSGIYNTAVGYQALPTNTTGASNTVIGFNGLAQLTTGNFNLAVGDWTGCYIPSGSYNTIIGSHVASGISSSLNNTLIIGTYNSVSIYSSSSGNIILGGSTTDNGLAKLQVNGGINQSSVKSALLKADANGTFVSAVAGVDYIAPGTVPVLAVSSGGTGQTTLAGVQNWLGLGSNAYTSTTYYPASNPSGFISGINSSMVTSALGYTPANNSDLNNYISWSRVSSSANNIASYDNNGYLQTASYIHAGNGDEGNASSPPRVWGVNGSDTYLRTYNTSSLSVGYAASAGSVAWSNVSSHPTNLSQFTNDLGNYGGFLTSESDPVFNSRTNNGEYLWSTSHPSNYYISNAWDGTYWYLTSNHGAPVRVGYSDNSGQWAGHGYSANISQWTNNIGYITGINASMVTAALGYVPYNSSNPSGYISGISSSTVTSALGYTPYNSSNPAGYISSYSETDPLSLHLSGGTMSGWINMNDQTISLGEYEGGTDPIRMKGNNYGTNTTSLDLILADDGGSGDAGRHGDGLAIVTTNNSSVHHFFDTQGNAYHAGSVHANGSFYGDGSGLTGTASSLSIGGTAAGLSSTLGVSSGGTGQTTLAGVQSWLGLGVNAFTSTAYLPSANIASTSGYMPYTSASQTLSNSPIYYNGTNIGIGTTSPSYKLDVAGTGRFAGALTIQDGTQGTGKILTSDPNGNTSWQSPNNLTSMISSFPNDITVNGLTVGKSGGNNWSNTALGVSALAANTSGYYNTAVGYQALPFNTTGADNTAIGFNSLAQFGLGDNNVALGGWTGPYIPSGYGNTLIGSHVADNISTSISNTLIIGTCNNKLIYSPESGNIILGGSTTDNGLAKLQVNGAINQSSVKSALLKADVNGTLVPAVAGVDYTTAGSGWSLIGNASTNSTVNFLGTTDNHPLLFKTNGVTKLYIDSITSNVGIGTTTPAQALEINGQVKIDTIENSNGLLPLDSVLVWRKSDSSLRKASQSQFTNGWSLTGNTGTNPSTNFIGTTDITDLVFKTNNTEQLRITSGGNVLIGKPSVTNSTYKLDVAGNVRANKLVVNTTGADFVFDSSYRLVPLTQVENFIQQNKHLPGIESAKQMQEEGLNVGDNQTKLLQKVEELTLYMIELKKENEKQQQEIEVLKTMLNVKKSN